jgi:hypothetical protein
MKFMKSIQTRAARIIARVFRIIFEIALDVELHLLSIQNHLDIALYDFLLRIRISFTYDLIKSQRTLSDRSTSQIQHQRSLYAQLSSLHKLETRYVVVFHRDLARFERRILFTATS